MSQTINPARGMRDFLPQDKKKRERAIDAIRAVYRSFGYEEIETPVLEDIDRLQSSGGGENLSMIFQVLKRGLPSSVPIMPDSVIDLGLRYDLTLPLARFYASNVGKLPTEFRTMQIGSVWRAERPQKGRFRQFTQCDIDIIGVADERAEVELIGVTLLALRAVSIENVTVRLNDRRLLIALLEAFGFESDVHGSTLIIIDKLDKIGVEGVSSALSEKYPDATEAIGRLMEFIKRVEVQRELDIVSFDDIASLIPSSIDKKLIEPLRYIDVNVRSGLPTASVRFDPTLVRGMGYYTGPIFEIEVEGLTSSIAGGGRYDGMIGRFSDKSVPACGFSLGFERIVELLPVQIEKSPMRLALFYEESIEPGVLLRHQIALVKHGYEVRAIRRPRKLGKSIEALASEGFGSFVELTESNRQSFSVKDVRPINSGDLVVQI